MTTIDQARQSGISSVGTIDINNLGGDSLQLMFAKLQLSLAESAKGNAMGYIQDIQKTQEEQKQLAAMLQEARQAQSDAKTNGSADLSEETIAYMKENGLAVPEGANTAQIQKTDEVLERSKQLRDDAHNGRGDCASNRKLSYMPADDVRFFKDNGIKYNTAGNDTLHYDYEWDENIKNLETYKASLPAPYDAKDFDVITASLQARMDSLGTDTQQKMVFVQDFMGQYNSYLQGANSVIQQSNQTLAELARAR